MIEKLYRYRFELFLTTQLALLFGTLLFPQDFFDEFLFPLLYQLSILSGILLISKNKKLFWLLIVMLTVVAFIFGSEMVSKSQNTENILIRLSIYFVFHIILTWNIIGQVWKAKYVTKNVIIGLISGYISLGSLAFLLFMSIELTHRGAFTGLLMEHSDFAIRADGILYFAYITLLTIGYGDIAPAIPISQKATILVGLSGQFYLVIFTAVIVSKYIRHSSNEG